MESGQGKFNKHKGEAAVSKYTKKYVHIPDQTKVPVVKTDRAKCLV
jgi:hypothetical protein